MARNLVPDHQHRLLGVTNDPRRIRTQQIVAKFGAMSRHRNQIGIGLVGNADDLPIDRTVANEVINDEIGADLPVRECPLALPTADSSNPDGKNEPTIDMPKSGMTVKTRSSAES